jgi:hypothetical protein
LDLAKEMGNKCLKYNKANLNAEELMGLISEKMNLLNEAVVFYENSWKLSNHSSAQIGYSQAKYNRLIGID